MVLFDFGATREISTELSLAYLALFKAVAKTTEKVYLKRHHTWVILKMT
ncbi:hypothetical protein P4S63_00500 [Pseudoalteromonas sp. B193]